MGSAGKIAGASIAIVVTAIAAAIAGIKKLVTRLDSIGKEASGLDITTGELQSLQFAAQRSHIPFEKVIRLFGKVNENVNKVKEGSLDAAKAFTALGISVKDLEIQSPLQNYLAVIEAIRRFPVDQSPDSALFKLFSSRDVKQLKQMAANNFDSLVDSSYFAGVIVDNETIQAAAGLADAIGTVNMQVIASLSNLLKMKEVMEGITKLAKEYQSRFNNYETAGRMPLGNKKIGIGNVIDLYEDELRGNLELEKLAEFEKRIAARALDLKAQAVSKAGIKQIDYEHIDKYFSPSEIRQYEGLARMEIYSPEVLKNERYREMFKNFDIKDPTTWIADKPRDFKATTQKAKNDLADFMVDDYIKQYNKEIEKLYGNIATIKGEAFDVDKAIQKIQADSEGGILSDEAIKKLRASAEELKKAKEALATATLEKETESLKRNNDITKAILDGDLDRANTLQLINELKAMGINIDEEELKKNEEKYKALQEQIKLQKELRFRQGLTDQGNSLLTQAMKQAGFVKEAAYMEALRNAEKTKGAKLTDEETEKVKRMTDLQLKLNGLGGLNLSGFDTKTNELTARGGFASGAVATSKDTINEQIKNYAAKQAQLLEDIKKEIKDGGLI